MPAGNSHRSKAGVVVDRPYAGCMTGVRPEVGMVDKGIIAEPPAPRRGAVGSG